MAAAHEIGLADPVEVLPLDMAAQNIHPVSERQKAFAAEYQVTFSPDFDEKDAGAVLSRYDREDATGIPVGLLQFVTGKRLRVSLLSSAWDLSFLVFEKLSPRDVLALYAASVRLFDAGSSLVDAPTDPVDAVCYAFRTPPPAPNGPANCRPANCSSRSRGPRRIGPPARFSALMRDDQALCRIALLIRFSISWSRTV